MQYYYKLCFESDLPESLIIKYMQRINISIISINRSVNINKLINNQSDSEDNNIEKKLDDFLYDLDLSIELAESIKETFSSLKHHSIKSLLTVIYLVCISNGKSQNSTGILLEQIIFLLLN